MGPGPQEDQHLCDGSGASTKTAVLISQGFEMDLESG
eukprot:CAMPEP_0196653670 /NCGR_PEP_ID=MMETSP1086-20130531/3326_1 /TAXON_ID=77921 /ORGANISM="Cyanoptyche  gloeocystis , Strain SAG4.97" /LENGTH=36 /DNA_ID= /DNA_START= /DNA_END= /DNA_ORIENTATION=